MHSFLPRRRRRCRRRRCLSSLLLDSWTGISIAVFSRFVMVPRPLAPARAMRSRTCAHVIQPCRPRPRNLKFLEIDVSFSCVYPDIELLIMDFVITSTK